MSIGRDGGAQAARTGMTEERDVALVKTKVLADLSRQPPVAGVLPRMAAVTNTTSSRSLRQSVRRTGSRALGGNGPLGQFHPRF